MKFEYSTSQRAKKKHIENIYEKLIMMKCPPLPKSCKQSNKDGIEPLSPKSVRTVLRRSIELKQQQKNEDLVAIELDQQREETKSIY